MTSFRASRALVLAGVLTGGVAAGAAREADASGPSTSPVRSNLILVTIDSLRPDHLGSYTGGAHATPVIDALAARGARFERVYSSSPSTAPSNASILTGLYPSRHGLRHDLGGRLDDAAATLAERLRGAGYATAAVIGSFHLDSDRGLDRGFDSYDDDIPGLRKNVTGRSRERRAGEVIERGLERLEQLPAGKPAFLWLNLYDPHLDYDPPPSQAERFKDSLYDGEVAYLDAQLQGLINGLRIKGLLNRTVIVLAGTHGEGLADHGETGHGVYLYESTIRVPLIMAGPGVPSARTIGAVVSLVDLTPTVLELAGVPVPKGLDGRSLRPYLAVEGEGAPPKGRPAADRILFSEAVQPYQAYGWAPLFAVVQGDRKIAQGRRTLSFDLRADPGEKNPLTPSPEWAATLVEGGRKIFGSLERSRAERRRIEEQVAAMKPPWDNSPTCVEKETWPDPRDPGPAALQDRLFRARLEADQGAPGSAAELAEEILPLDPTNFTALDLQLAFSMRGSGIAQMADRIELLQCNYPDRGAGYHYLGHYYLARNEPEKAIPPLKLMAMVEPWNEEAEYDLATIYAGLGQKDEAFKHLGISIRNGARDYEFIRNDPRLQGLRADPRFQDLLGPVRAGAENQR